MRVSVFTCQNATLLETIYRGSNNFGLLSKAGAVAPVSVNAPVSVTGNTASVTVNAFTIMVLDSNGSDLSRSLPLLSTFTLTEACDDIMRDINVCC